MNALTPAGSTEQPKPRYSRRRFKVEYLPEDAQAYILGAFIAGKPHRQISQELRAQGITISAAALCRYWQECWAEQHKFLRHARACVALIAHALKQDPEGDLAKIGRELLYTMVFEKLNFLRGADPFKLLHEAREIDKVSLRQGKSSDKPPPASSLSDQDLDRKIREIYGLPEPPHENHGQDSEK